MIRSRGSNAVTVSGKIIDQILIVMEEYRRRPCKPSYQGKITSIAIVKKCKTITWNCRRMKALGGLMG